MPFGLDTTRNMAFDSCGVHISLAAIDDPADVRHLTVAPNSRITIGRASRSEAKNLQASPNNALFDCPVMSRVHAEIKVHPFRLVHEQITITDQNSMHGTIVNGRRLTPFSPHTLKAGDVVKLGDRVQRGSVDSHDGLSVAFSRSANTASTSNYAVPLESGSDSESSFSDDEMFSSAKTTPEEAKDRAGSQEKPIDLDTPPTMPLTTCDILSARDNLVAANEGTRSPPSRVIQDTYAGSEQDFAEDDEDDDGESDMSISQFADQYPDYFSDGEEEQDQDDEDQETEEQLEEASVHDQQPQEMEQELEYAPIQPQRSPSPETGLSPIQEVPSCWQSSALQPDLPPYSCSGIKPPFYPACTTRSDQQQLCASIPCTGMGVRPSAPPPVSRISISDIVENFTNDETPDTTTAGPASLKRKAEDISNDAVVEPPLATATLAPASFVAYSSPPQNASENKLFVYKHEPEAVQDQPPPVKKARKTQTSSKARNAAKHAATYATVFLAGGMGTVAFLASPLAQRLLDVV
ncbi:hypothetical protein B0A50_02448 [Salinomyces thailandicus]|uniref:FHA domain-containing protein n=1 Tax=Salinomyces thailandicus TaxID=706561 RepID=A0A4U0U6N9_9PEZI|nr:hypothetical protein B0A50_02448 [Salinomyces thailandica]